MALFRRGGDRSRSESSRTAAPFLQVAQRFGALHSAKAATEDDHAFGARPWRGKQLTSTGKLVTTDKLPVRCVLRWILFMFNRLWSHAETGTGEAEVRGRHRVQ